MLQKINSSLKTTFLCHSANYMGPEGLRCIWQVCWTSDTVGRKRRVLETEMRWNTRARTFQRTWSRREVKEPLGVTTIHTKTKCVGHSRSNDV